MNCVRRSRASYGLRRFAPARLTGPCSCAVTESSLPHMDAHLVWTFYSYDHIPLLSTDALPKINDVHSSNL
ncbi:hypothetical protein J1605_003542 [Eschrichtius robustus]|uniref:Uncharacterized protein n=1 Tax=Eschrichtius robustus TaxID=9764 RepID=A0AB34HRP3_ESCRO|nr:hypothetical protein J1605_003542 [Eschrichtius robustus]